ncbi:head-tail connector protein [Heyndrickxia oleronia]|uniref:hypothetical protein n=1 Tax=Heyndrickxia oleronia TaxID=38875 RepID=UPI001B2997A6|nr:hypothetical protein [Heyndrickxia oleronia]GIN37800.1 hypothetical protein J19TS1_07490 [Heyndrickxia oleronia]
MNVLDIVKAKLPEDELPDEKLLNVYVEEVGQSIMTYCNREDIPRELQFVHANIVIDLINAEKRRVDPEGQTAVSSIKEGDVQVTFGSTRLETRERETEKLLFDYVKQLNRFRKLRW